MADLFTSGSAAGLVHVLPREKQTTFDVFLSSRVNMVGKIRHVRQKLHHEAVRLDTQLAAAGTRPRLQGPPGGEPLGGEPPTLETTRSEAEKKPAPLQVQRSSFPSRIFAGTKISKEALVQKLNFEKPPDVPSPPQKGPEQRKLKTKRVKLNEKREQWLKKIITIRLAKEQQAAAARRKATPVVGDMQPLADALPELCQLVTSTSAPTTTRRKSRKNKTPVKKPEPTDFSQMKQSQKRKLLETEAGRFSDAVKILSSKSNPLADIGEQLRKRMRQEEEEGPS